MARSVSVPNDDPDPQSGQSQTTLAHDRTAARYAADTLCAFATELLSSAGVREDIARDVAAILLDGDLMGHTTHGLALLPAYLNELANGKMRKAGEPRIAHASTAAQTW